MTRSPPSGSSGSATLPGGVVPFDRSAVSPIDQYRFYVPYVDGHVLDFSGGLAENKSIVIR
jgi:hypothetical protein